MFGTKQIPIQDAGQTDLETHGSGICISQRTRIFRCTKTQSRYLLENGPRDDSQVSARLTVREMKAALGVASAKMFPIGWGAPKFTRAMFFTLPRNRLTEITAQRFHSLYQLGLLSYL